MPGKIREKIEIIENFHCIHRIAASRIESFGEQINKGFIRIGLIYDFSPAKNIQFHFIFQFWGHPQKDCHKLNQKSYMRFFLSCLYFLIPDPFFTYRETSETFAIVCRYLFKISWTSKLFWCFVKSLSVLAFLPFKSADFA